MPGSLLARSIVAAFALVPAAGQDLLFRENGTEDDERFGFSAAVLPDLNGDGLAEFMVGVPYRDAGILDAGVALVYAGPQGPVLFTVQGPAQWDHAGTLVGHAGDLDADGSPDFMVGFPGDDTVAQHAGALRVYSGADGSLLLDLFGTDADEQLGRAACSVGDVDGDGFGDLVVGSSAAIPGGVEYAGCVKVVSGATGQALHTFDGTMKSAQVGATVAGLGDVDGDGVGDFAMNRYRPLPAVVEVRSGATGALLWDTAPGTIIASLAGAGDLDGDGRGDLLLGGWNWTRVYSGASGALLRLHDQGIDAGAGYLYQDVAGGEDVNGDGWPDYAIGVYWYHYPNQTQGNYVQVRSGFDGAVIGTISGDTVDAHMGHVVGLGDTDGDDLADLIAGAPRDAQKDKGQVVVYGFGFDTRLFCGGEVNSTGLGATLEVVGSVEVAVNDFTLLSTQLPANKTTFFITSRSVGQFTPPGSQGTLCLGGGIGRFVGPGQVLNSGAMGQAELKIDLTQHASAGGLVAVAAGQTWHYQAWYRDDVGAPTSNFSDGVAVNFE